MRELLTAQTLVCRAGEFADRGDRENARRCREVAMTALNAESDAWRALRELRAREDARRDARCETT